MGWFIFFVACWYVSGVWLFLATCVAIDPVLLRKDLVVAVFAGLLGPINGFYWLQYSSWGEKSVYEKR